MGEQHEWKVMGDTGNNKYLKCSKCGDRVILAISEDSRHPIDYNWTNGKRPSVFCKF